MMFLPSCAQTDRLAKAAAEQGIIAAGVNLPEWPEDCRKKEAHAPITEGAEARSVLIRERGALDRQNARGDRCSAFYDRLRAELSNLSRMN